jgi:TetR/AcrR family transcriptional regulator
MAIAPIFGQTATPSRLTLATEKPWMTKTAKRPPAAPARKGAAPKSAPRPPLAARLRKQDMILLEAEAQFGRTGFDGVSLDSVAAKLGISRQGLLYYYPSKETLYLAVLDGVLNAWLQTMQVLAKESEPETAISNYIASKLRFSQQRPSGSAVFTREVMAGAPLYLKKIEDAVGPSLQQNVRVFENWAERGLVKKIDFTHLMFIMWSTTQAYADLSHQFALLMGKKQLEDSDFATARELITTMVMKVLRGTVKANSA